MNYSKIVIGLAAGLAAANLTVAATSAQCPDAAGCRATAGFEPTWAYVVYPEASHVVYPDGVLKFGH